MLSIACHPTWNRQNAKVHGADLKSKRVLLLIYPSWFSEAPLIAVQDFGAEGQPMKFCQLKEDDELKSIAVGPPGSVRWFAVLSLLAFVQIYDFANPTQPLISCESSCWTEEYESHALSMSKIVLAIGKMDRSVELYDVLTGRRMRSIFAREWPQTPEESKRSMWIGRANATVLIAIGKLQNCGRSTCIRTCRRGSVTLAWNSLPSISIPTSNNESYYISVHATIASALMTVAYASFAN
jgi:hypothetical protein